MRRLFLTPTCSRASFNEPPSEPPSFGSRRATPRPPLSDLHRLQIPKSARTIQWPYGVETGRRAGGLVKMPRGQLLSFIPKSRVVVGAQFPPRQLADQSGGESGSEVEGGWEQERAACWRCLPDSQILAIIRNGRKVRGGGGRRWTTLSRSLPPVVPLPEINAARSRKLSVPARPRSNPSRAKPPK